MSSFRSYARSYDAFYKDKDYVGEADYVRSVLEAHVGPCRGKKLLELGCGTGRHARLLAQHGFQLHGVDLSPDMVARARDELGSAAPQLRDQLTFAQGDLRTLRIGKTFDAVISLFHVMSYQTSQQDLEAALATARTHLVPGGVFMFDAWYGPGVLLDPPSVRTKRAEDGDRSYLRLSEPVLHANANRVDVNYTLFTFQGPDTVSEVVRETHAMRYWFHPEIEQAARRTGFEIVEFAEWMKRRTPDANTWNAYWVLKAG